MKSRRKLRKFFHLMQREAAERYLFLTLLSFAGTVTVTRLFLSLSGYPQIGNGEIHIAHVLWGGLLLYIAALLPLLFANRRVYLVGAILAGMGVGLFIDEVGKFITQSNDYFFPIAASIIYAFFLLSILLFIRIRQAARIRGRNELSRAIEDIWVALHHPLSPLEYSQLKWRLEIAANGGSSQRDTELAKALLKFLETDESQLPMKSQKPPKQARPIKRMMIRLISDNYLRIYLIIGMVAIGLLTLKNPVSFILAPWLPPEFHTLLASLYLGRQVDASSAPLWFSIRLVLEVFVGGLLLTSAGFLMARKDRQGTGLGYVALLLSLTTVNILLFYFEQFSTIITTTIQFLLLIGIMIYRRHKWKR